jgi:PAS domain S-box-containing protein
MPAQTEPPEARQAPEDTPALAQRLLRLGAPIPWAIALLCFVLAASAAVGGLALRDRIIADAERELAVLATSIAAVTEARLKTFDKSLRRIALQADPERLADEGGRRALGTILAVEQETVPTISALAVVDAAGTVVAASRAAIAAGSAAGWSNVQALRESGGTALRIGNAHEGAAQGVGGGPAVVISRAIVHGTEVAGAAEAILSLEAEHGLLHVPPLADGLRLSLRHIGGAVLIERSGASSEHSATIRLVATAPLSRHELTVIASRPLESVLATWRKSMQAMAGVTLILCAGGIGLAVLARASTQRQAALARAAVERAETADAIAGTIDIVLWSMDARTRRWIHLSPSITRITGHPRSVFLAGPDAWLDLVHPDDREAARAAFAGLADATSVEYRLRTASGGEVVLQDSARAVRNARGEIIRHDGMAIDITRRKRAEAALDEARRVANLGAWQIHLADQRLEWSPEIFAQFRLAPAEFEPTVEGSLALIHPDDLGLVRRKLAEAAEGAEPDFDFRIIRGDGSLGWIWSEARVARDAHGRPVRLYGVCQDITERKQAEERAARAGQLAALGELTGGIAHDFNNLLAVVRLNLEIMSDALTDPTLRECAANAAVAAEQGAKLTSQLLAFARRQPMQGGRVEVGAALGRVGRMLDHGLGRNIRLTIDVAPDVVAVDADEAQFDSAVMNLAINARDAMPEGGSIDIRARRATLGRAEAEALGLAPGAYVRLTVADDGQGMSAETRARAFEPFFTTKRGGKGSGLGLTMVYGFVKQAHGEITLESAPGRGTTVTLWLPVAMLEADVANLEPAEARQEAFEGTVLLVEDEPGLREAGARLLADAGFVVHAAASAEAALAILDSLPAPPDLLFTDIMLGGAMDGFALARDIRARCGGIAVLYASGYVGEDKPREADAPILRKPFGGAQLRTAVAGVLASRAVARREAA